MPTLYDDLISGVQGHFYRLKIQNPKNKSAIRVDSISANYGESPILLVKEIIYGGDNFIKEGKQEFIHFTDIKSVERISDEEEKEIKSKLELLAKDNKTNLSSQKFPK